MTTEINKASKLRAKNDRKAIAEKIISFEKKPEETSSQRKSAKLLGVPRTTIQYWADRKAANPLPGIIVECFESPEGLLFLHQLTTAAQFVMTQIGGCGIRLVSLFFKLSQLDQFVACSYGTLQKRGVAMEKGIIKFGQQERETLSKSMQPREITMAEDETFHPRICLVGIEPVSNFILLEQYSDKRDAKSWNDVVDEALSGMPVKIIQTTADEAKGILCHTKKHLGAHHSSDVFHVQYELTKATAAPQAEKSLIQCEKNTRQAKNKKANHEQATKPRRRGRPPNFSRDIVTAEQQENDARLHLESCKERQANVKKAKKGISEVYHPYDLKTGRSRNCDELKQALDDHLDTIKKVSKQSGLSQSCHNRIAKAGRVCKELLATLAFFWMIVSKHISEILLPGELEKLLYDDLIPFYYLQMAAKKAKGAYGSGELVCI